MSIYGNGDYSVYQKTENLTHNNRPSNIYEIRNVLNKRYFQHLIHDVESEFSLIIGELLGMPMDEYMTLDDNINILDIDSDIYSKSQLKTGLYIATKNFSLYFKTGEKMYLIPYNLTNFIMDATNKSEFEAVYYCKYADIHECYNHYDSHNGHIGNRNDFDYIFQYIPKNFYNNGYNSNVVSGTLFEKFLSIEDNPNKVFYIPKVAIHTWKIPIFTDAHINTTAFIRDLDVQIDFMPSSDERHPGENLLSARVKLRDSDNPENYFYKYGEDIENIAYDKDYGVYPSPDGTLIKFLNSPVYKSSYTFFKDMNIYTLNKRPNRHCRYLISAYGFATKPNYPGIQEVFPAMWVKVNKIYDTEGEQPMSSGFRTKTKIRKNGLYDLPNLNIEGIHPDPEDLTNPMDIAVDFEFVQCKVDKNFNPIDDIDIGFGDKKTLLGHLVLKSYSGLVGSTLRDGRFDYNVLDEHQEGLSGSNTATSYGYRTRPHDCLFKVTLRAPKYINMSGGNFADIKRNSEDSEVDDFSARKIWKLLKDNNVQDEMFCIDTRSKKYNLDKDINPNKDLESPIYFFIDKPSANFVTGGYSNGGITPENISNEIYDYKYARYNYSELYMWGEYDFYKYKILDKGGYLRPPVQDTYMWQAEMQNLMDSYKTYTRNYLSGYVNPVTTALACYYYHTDVRVRELLKDANVGGINFKLEESPT